MAVVGLTMLLLVVVINLLVMRYADGVLQAAVEEGARQGAAAGFDAACEDRVAHVVAAGLGPMRDQVAAPVCVVGRDGVTAQASATWAGWVPLVPTHATSARASVAGPVVD